MPVVVDTNVWVVAAGRHAVASASCVTACLDELDGFRALEQVLAVDTDWRILGEYFDNLPHDSTPHRILRFLLRVAGGVEYRECRWHDTGCALVPECLECLDGNDRKFAAVALTYDPPAAVLNAVDPDWNECADACAQAGLRVRELCADASAKEA